MKDDLFESAPVPKAYLTLALPVVLSMMVSLVYNMVDTYFIALTGNTALVAGVSLMTPLFTLMVAFGDIWGLGGSSLISRLFGAKRYEEAKQASAFAYWASILFGICVTVILLIFRTPILSALGADAETLPYASAYYTWIAVGAAAIIFGLVPTNLLRTEGMAVQAMIGSLLGSVINIFLDPICIFALHQGAAGAAIATVIGNVCADIYYISVTVRKSKRLSVLPSDAHISVRMVREMLTIGIPSSVTNMMQSFMVAVNNHFLLPYGTEKIAAMGIALKVNMISMLILVGFAFGGQPLIGYCYGAGNRKRLRETIRFAYLSLAGCALAFTVVMMVFAPQLIRVFMNDPEIVSSGALMLRCLQVSLVFIAVVLVSVCICQSFGKAAGATVLSLSRQGIVYVIAVFVLSYLLHYQGVLIAQACADVITAAIAVWIIRRIFKEIPESSNP